MTIAARFRVDRGEFALDVDLRIPSGGITSLFGPSGCGKTTLLRAIAGLERLPGGCLQVGDESWQAEGRFVPAHRRPIGYVFQEASLFPHLDVRGNLEYGQRRAAAGGGVALEEAIALLGIAALLDRSPDTLSGGERQRVAIARALAVNPRLLLMDEPLASLDRERKREIMPYLESLHRDLEIPVIYVSHEPDEVARLADHVVLMARGEVLGSGTVHEMFTRLDLPLVHGDEAAAIIDAAVAGHDAEYHLTQLEFAGGLLTIAREDLPEGLPVRLRIAARDVSLTLAPQTGTSILNILPARIEEISPESEAMATVRLQAGGVPLLARVTRKSARLLDLQPGKEVCAQVKSVALLA